VTIGIYARVSTEDQAERYGLAAQLRELRAKAGSPALEFVDDGVSGATLERPGLARLREAARRGQLGRLLILDPDRLSRRLVHQLLLLDELQRHGVAVEFLRGSTEDTAEGRLLLNVQGVIAEYEREKIRERTLRGKREKALRGLVIGQVPYGARVADAASGTVLIDDQEAAIVRMIYRWLVDEQRSLATIAEELTALGIRPRRARVWAKTSIRRILSDPFYRGAAYFNRRQRQGSRLVWRPADDWIAVPVPPIVSAELWQQAQAQLQVNARHLVGQPGRRYVYLLRGLIRCKRCGRAYHGQLHHGTPIYRCGGARRPVAGVRCRNRRWTAHALETQVWAAVAAAIKHPERLRAGAEALRVGDRVVAIKSELEALRAELAKLDRQEQRLLDLYLDDGLTVPGLQARLDAFRDQKVTLAARISTAEGGLADHEALAASQRAAAAFCRRLRAGIDHLSLDGQQRVLRALGTRVLSHPDHVEVCVKLGGDNRPDHQYIVGAGRGDLQAALGVRVPAHVREIEPVAVRGGRSAEAAVRTCRGDLTLTVEVLDRVVQCGDGDDLDARDHAGLGRVRRRYEQRREALPARVQRDREDAAHRPYATVERQLAHHERAIEPAWLHEAGGAEDADRHRQVEGRALLAELGRGEIYRDPIDRKLEAHVADRGPDAVAALPHGGIRKPHRGE
jgi:site-specific DNA recombinase